MKNLLFITLIDYGKSPNNRVHNIVKYLSQRFKNVTILYKPSVYYKSLIEQFKYLFSFKLSVSKDNNIKIVKVKPFLDHSAGLGVTIVGLSSPYEEVLKSWLKRVSIKVLSFIGIITEISYLICYLLAFFIKVKDKFDVCIVQGHIEGVIGVWLKKLGKVKILIYDDNDYTPGYAITNRLRRKFVACLESYSQKKVDLIISVGFKLKELREQQTGKKVEIIQNGVDYQLFKQAQEKIPHPPTLIYIGYIGGWDGLDIILQALPKVKKEISNIRILIVGRTTPLYEAYLKKLVQGLRLDDCVYFLGVKEYIELPAYLKESDIGLAMFKPTELRKYAFSLKVIEYISAGLPVITTKGLEMEHFVNKYNCGEVVDFDKDKVAKSITLLLKDKQRYNTYSHNAKKYSEEFDWDILLKKEYDLIEQCFHRVG
ncbi:MAG: glycosyltransferase [bacterium]